MLFESKKMKITLGDTTIQCTCKYCHNAVTLNAHRIETKLTFRNKPFYTKTKINYVVCPVCNYKEEISNRKLNRYLSKNARLIRL